MQTVHSSRGPEHRPGHDDRNRRPRRLIAAVVLTLGLGLGAQLGAIAPARAEGPAPVLDRYGQLTSTDWPGKVTSDDQLRADVAKDEAYYSSLTPPKRTRFGGDLHTPKSLKLKKTGYFHVEKRGGRSVMVDPGGAQYFQLAATAFASAGDTFTRVRGRESDYAWLPDRSDTGAFSAGWRDQTQDDYSFHIANQVRKYGSYDEASYIERQRERYAKWGFNAYGGWTPDAMIEGAEEPWVMHLDGWIPEGTVGSTRVPDVYTPGFREQLATNLADPISRTRNDPFLTGYMFTNEIRWSWLRNEVPAADVATSPAKRELIRQLKAKYTTITAFNQAWGLSVDSWQTLGSTSFRAPIEGAAVTDMDAYVAGFMERFYQTFADTIRSLDPNHMVIGDRWLFYEINNDTIRRQLAKAAGRHLDAISYNFYSYDLRQDRIKEIYELSGGTPLIITEFHFGDPSHGQKTGVYMADDETEKGELYRNYVEQAAASGMVIGTHWFTYLDQSATGRWFEGYNGERGALGLLDVTDRPYRKMLTNVVAAHANIYNVMDGRRPAYDHAFSARQDSRQSDLTTDIPRASTAPVIDGVLDDDWPTGPTLTVGADDVMSGTAIEGGGAGFRLAWDDQKLYLHATVTDPTPMRNPYTGADVWNGDAVELLIGPKQAPGLDGMQLTDSQLLIAGSVGPDGRPEFDWANDRVDEPEIESAVRPSADGWTLEAAIDLADLRLAGTEVGREIEFDVVLDDGDGQGRQRQYYWNSVSANMMRQTWGRATFSQTASAESDEDEALPTRARIDRNWTVTDGQVKVTGTGAVGAGYQVRVDGRQLAEVTVDVDGHLRAALALPKGTRPGLHLVTVTHRGRLLDATLLRVRPAPRAK